MKTQLTKKKCAVAQIGLRCHGDGRGRCLGNGEGIRKGAPGEHLKTSDDKGLSFFFLYKKLVQSLRPVVRGYKCSYRQQTAPSGEIPPCKLRYDRIVWSTTFDNNSPSYRDPNRRRQSRLANTSPRLLLGRLRICDPSGSIGRSTRWGRSVHRKTPTGSGDGGVGDGGRRVILVSSFI